MNRKNLTAAVLAGLAGVAGIASSAQAVNINPDGVGQVLVYPYYTTNAGNSTVLSVVNTTEHAKAVKVRFLEGQNSQEVLDFNLYMSAFDVWAASISDVDGTPTLTINDTTCTVPYLYMNTDANGVRDGKQEFLTLELDDGGPTSISRAAEGHFEMIEMGTLVDATEWSAKAATHVADPLKVDPAMPPDTWIPVISAAFNNVARPCGQLVDAWSDPDDTVSGDEGYWLNKVTGSPLIDLEAPSGGLFGGAAVVNVNQGTMYSYDATAVNGFAIGLTDTFGEALHQAPGLVKPGLNSGDVLDATVFMDDGTLQMRTFARGVDAVSYAFMHDQIMNEYTTENSVNAATEWVITFPTKQFYVFKEQSGSTSPVDPFTSTWGFDALLGAYGACEIVQLESIWDREEQDPFVSGDPVPPVVSPSKPTVKQRFPFELCYETSVIRFGDELTAGIATEILGSTNYHNIDNVKLGYENGWARLQMADYPPTNPATGEIVPGPDLTRELGNLDGLPVVGFSVNRFENGMMVNNPGVLANYGGIFDHKATRRLNSNP